MPKRKEPLTPEAEAAEKARKHAIARAIATQLEPMMIAFADQVQRNVQPFLTRQQVDELLADMRDIKRSLRDMQETVQLFTDPQR